MATIDADYLGGDPEVTVAPAAGKLAFSEGAMSFSGQVLTSALASVSVSAAIAKDQLRAISIGDANQVRALTRGAAGALIGGAVGGLIGMATGRRSTLLLIAAERGGFSFVSTFAATANDARWLLDAVQRGRHDRAESPLPKIEDLAARAAAAAGDEQLQLLRDIRALLMEQVGLLRELGDRITRG